MKLICSCCGNEFEISSGATLVMFSGPIYRICIKCIDRMWKQRNPDFKQLRKKDGKASTSLPTIAAD